MKKVIFNIRGSNFDSALIQTSEFTDESFFRGQKLIWDETWRIVYANTRHPIELGLLNALCEE